MLYSAELSPFAGTLPAAVQEAVDVICRHYKIQTPQILGVDETRIVIPVAVNVSVPPNGTIGGVDIREHEPVLIRFDLDNYPDIPPTVLSDRKDFPRNQLSHLYASPPDDPAAKLCLVRGDLAEWFSRHRLENLLEVVDQWFFKAATGQLNDDGNEFDPLRLDSYKHNHVYRYNRFKQVIEEKISFLPDQPFACFITMGKAEHKDDEKDYVFRTELPVQAATVASILEEVRRVQGQEEGDANKGIFVSLLFWHPDGSEDATYHTEFPRNYSSLKEQFKLKKIDLDAVLKALIEQKYITKVVVPITYAIKRPKKVIGFEGNYEFITYLLFNERNKSHVIDPSSKVAVLKHVEPFSDELAAKVAGEYRTSKNLFIGGGSLGSKITLHFARSGNADIGICDNDTLMQHNMVRHALLPAHVGRNKAVALADELNSMAEFTPRKNIRAYPIRVFRLPDKIFERYEAIIDTTASIAVRNWLVLKNFTAPVQISRCELVDEGKVGLLYIEGNDRNPRIDDLSNLAIFRALKYPALRAWRRGDAEKGQQTLDIGLGCSSLSAVMPDDSISLHAASFSQVLYSQKDRKDIGNAGLFYFQSVDTRGIPGTYSRNEVVAPFDVYTCKQGSGWEVRFYPGLRAKLLAECKKFKPRETGGVLIGVCNYKTKTIHVFDVVGAPPDSKRTATLFVRGNKGLPEKIEQYKQATGDVIGYVGEWHTHPMQLERLSGRDMETVERLLPKNRQEPIPTLSLIVTNTDLLPFIFL